MNDHFCVYVHICPNNKKYVGITGQTPHERWKNGHGYQNNRHFYNAINKYGWENIQHIVLADHLSFADACELEKKYICDFNSVTNGYNHSYGGEASAFGFHHTQEAKAKIAEALRGRKRSAKSIQSTIEAKKRGVKVYDLDGNFIKSFEKIVDAEQFTGIDNANISAVCRGKYKQCKGYIFRYADDSTEVEKVRCKTKPVEMYSLDGEFIKRYESIKQAGRELNIPDTHISDACKGRYTQSGGYIWKYA